MKKIKIVTCIVFIIALLGLAVLTSIDLFYSLGVEDKIYEILNSKLGRIVVKCIVICISLGTAFIVHAMYKMVQEK